MVSLSTAPSVAAAPAAAPADIPAASPAAVPAAEPRLFALVPCAGVGARSGATQPKQYVGLAGEAMVAHTLRALLAVRRLSAVMVVLSPGDEQFGEAAPFFEGARCWREAVGGDTRAATVLNGLRALAQRGAQAEDWVLVHDAARCLVQAQWVDRLIDACLDDRPGRLGSPGGLLALPVADTLKAELEGRVARTLDRRHTWAAQTPQMFRLGLLQRALEAAEASGLNVTDESSAIEALGLTPLLVEAPSENFKVTWPADFALAERLLKTRNSAPHA
jgi:2-C-methyl-D-erythritol 4-phosphate cytidylyltransferase